MSHRTIVVEGPDGNTVSYETTTETREALEEEVGRYFPQAQDWRLATTSGMDADSAHDASEGLGTNQTIMISIIIFALICLGLVGSMLSTIFFTAP